MSHAMATELKIALAYAHPKHMDIIHRIESVLFTQSHPPLQITLFKKTELENVHPSHFSQFSLIISLGEEATIAAMRLHSSQPILCSLIYKSNLQNLLTRHEFKHQQHPIGAIYLDQPYLRQFRLIRSIIPIENQKAPIGVIIGPYSKQAIAQVREAAGQQNFETTFAFMDKEDNPVAVLDELLNKVQVVLAIPDRHVYNSRTARGMLLTAYRKQVPIIGFSKTYVSNGALASVYSTPQQIVDQICERILKFQKTRHFEPTREYIKQFLVAVNPQVARSLELDLPSAKAMEQQILDQENGSPQVALRNGEVVASPMYLKPYRNESI